MQKKIATTFCRTL